MPDGGDAVHPDVCGRCGAARDPANPAALAWVRETDPAPGWLCVACARSHLRAIEARLRPEWW